MWHFRHDEAGYLRWLADNPNGYVLNVPCNSSGVLVLHHAWCHWIHGDGPTNFTGGQYTKLCASTAEQLRTWAANDTRRLNSCGTCLSSERATAKSQPASPSNAILQPSIGEADVPPALSWDLWTQGRILAEVNGIEPQLESWERMTHRSQVQLKAYLDDVVAALGPLPDSEMPLFLHLDVDRRYEAATKRQPDIENYLTPVARRLGARHFCLVSGTKRAGGGSRILVGEAEQASAPDSRAWESFGYYARSGAGTKEWKIALRQAMLAAGLQPLPCGPVEVQLAWHCSPSRSWLNCWKPTGDAMGPVLGEPDSAKPFNPSDDRIVSLRLHRVPEIGMGYAVETGLWWRNQQLLPC
jgi:hypothetical protein